MGGIAPGRPGVLTVPRTRGPFARGEMKYSDAYRVGVAVPKTTTWAGAELDPSTANCLFSPVQGNDINNREGRHVYVTKLKLRGVISTTVLQDQADAIGGAAVRLILVQDQQTNGTQMNAEDLMASPQAANVSLTFCQFQNLQNFGRFKVLKDKIFYPKDPFSQTDGANTASECMSDIPFKWNIRFKTPVSVRFNATNGGTIADIVDNSFHLIGTKSSAGYATVLDYNCRVCFKE